MCVRGMIASLSRTMYGMMLPNLGFKLYVCMYWSKRKSKSTNFTKISSLPKLYTRLCSRIYFLQKSSQGWLIRTVYVSYVVNIQQISAICPRNEMDAVFSKSSDDVEIESDVEYQCTLMVLRNGSAWAEDSSDMTIWSTSLTHSLTHSLNSPLPNSHYAIEFSPGTLQAKGHAPQAHWHLSASVFLWEEREQERPIERW